MNKNKFKYLEKSPTPFCNPGSKIRIENTLVFNGNNMELKEVRRVDIRAEINSHLESTSLERLIDRYQMSGGDTSLLNQRVSFQDDFGDLDPYDDLQTVTERGRAATQHLKSESMKARKQRLDSLQKKAEVKEKDNEPTVDSE